MILKRNSNWRKLVGNLLVTSALPRDHNEVDATAIQTEHRLYRTVLSLRQRQPILIPALRMRQFTAGLFSGHTSHTVPAEDNYLTLQGDVGSPYEDYITFSGHKQFFRTTNDESRMNPHV